MTDTLAARIWALTDEQALAACAALATGLELELNMEGLDTTRLDALVDGGSPRERALRDDLEGASPAESANAARTMLGLAADLGYGVRVSRVIDSSAQHGRDFGLVSGPVLIAALAVVLAYVPIEQKSKVTRLRSRGADGSMHSEDVTETKTKRVGATAVEKLADWWKSALGK